MSVSLADTSLFMEVSLPCTDFTGAPLDTSNLLLSSLNRWGDSTAVSYDPREIDRAQLTPS